MAQKKKHGGTKGMLEKAQDMAGGMAGVVSASASGGDSRAFVENAGIGDLYELEAARIALQRSRTESVRDFAATMLEHHTTAMHQMRSGLRSSEVTSQCPGLSPARSLDERHEKLVSPLRDAPDDDFDNRYLSQQKLAHDETSRLLQTYVDFGDNPQLRSIAMGALPMVRRHREMLSRMKTH